MKEAMDNSFDQIDGITMTINCPSKNLNWSGSIGYDSREKKDSLETDQPFRVASITKTFVAAAILKLHEMDSLSIHDPLSKYISKNHIALLSQDEYELDDITLLHCLNHTSGLYDYAMGGSPYIKIARETPEKRWTRTEQLKFAVTHGDKLGYPGEKYNYSDTGYILLGEIISNFFNGDLAIGLRTLIDYNKLGMHHTWLESLEPEPVNIKDCVHRYLGRLDATKFDPSIDLYGGGGIVSTTEDLSKFMQALFNLKIFSDKETLELMLQKPVYDESYDTYHDKRYKDYRQGLWQIKLMSNEVYMHSGLWGTHILYQPHNNTSLAINFTRAGSDRMIKKILMAVNNFENKQ